MQEKQYKATRRSSLYFLAFVIFLVAAGIVSNYDCYFVGFIMWLVFSTRAQTVLDNNLFLRYFLISLFVFAIFLIKQMLTVVSYPALLAALLPFVYVLILKVLVLTLFPNYLEGKLPVIISYTKWGIFWKGKEEGYKPSKTETFLSILLQVVIFIYMLGIVCLMFLT